MREIRFRAWDNELHQMYPDWQLHPDFAYLLEDKRFSVMQYTGLKDKNGKEIYEGDIVKDYPFNHRKPFAVEWDIHHAGFDRLYDRPEHFGVIGNIYETPELKDML